MKNRLLLTAAAFVMGFIMAWMLKPDDPAHAEEASATAPSLHPRDTRPGPGIRSATVDPRILKRVKQLNDSAYVSDDDLDKIPAEDLPGLIQAIANSAGLTGLDYSQESTLESLLHRWHQDDPSSAESWVVTLSSEKDQAELLSGLIGELSDHDWDAAVDLARRRGIAEGRELEMDAAIHKISKLSPEEFAEFASLFVSASGSGGSTIDYPADFDFEATLNQLDAARKNLPDGYDYRSMPTNLLSEWATRDFEAAWEWSNSDKSVPYNDQSSLLDGVAPLMTKEELILLSARLVREGKDRDDSFRSAWQILAESGGPETLHGFLNQLEGTRQDNINQLFATSLRGYGGSFDSFKQLMLEQMTVQERMAAFQYINSSSSSIGANREKFEPMLHRLGHSDAEIEQMLSPNP